MRRSKSMFGEPLKTNQRTGGGRNGAENRGQKARFSFRG
jgi:hypothetical protein